MANIRKREDGKTLRWQVRWREGGMVRSETFPTEARAVKFRGHVDAAGQHYPENWVPGFGFVAPAAGEVQGPSLAEWFVRSIASRSGANPRTRDDYERDFSRNVPSWLAEMSIGSITREDVGRWLIELQGKGLSAKSIHNTHSTVSSVMKDAQADDLIRRNPFHGQSKSIPVRHEDMCFLTPGEYDQFREFIVEYYRPFVDFLFTTGLRFGEATALMPHHVDLTEKRLHVTTAWKRQPDGTYLSQEPKSLRARRTLTLTDRQVEVLKGLIEPRELIFRNHRGDRIQQSTFHGDTWTPALKRVREVGFTKRPRPHDLRHSHAAYLLSTGRPMLAVSRRLGHASITTTNDRYGHLLPHVDQDMVAAMNDIGY
jgi:integrase